METDNTGEVWPDALAVPMQLPPQPCAAEMRDDDGFFDPDGLFRIERCMRVASGGTRIVYQHPFQDGMLIKIIRPEIVGRNGAVVTSRKRRRKFRIARLRPFGVYVTFHREMRETLRLARRTYPRLDFPFPFPRAHGLIWTTQGLGLVVEKIASSDNSLAPSLHELLEAGRFTETHWRQLKALFELCERHHLVVGDLNPHNFLYQDIGGGRFVVIDSIGEKSWIPIYELSFLCNRLKLRHKFRLLAERIRNRTDLRLEGA